MLREFESHLYGGWVGLVLLLDELLEFTSVYARYVIIIYKKNGSNRGDFRSPIALLR